MICVAAEASGCLGDSCSSLPYAASRAVSTSVVEPIAAA